MTVRISNSRNLSLEELRSVCFREKILELDMQYNKKNTAIDELVTSLSMMASKHTMSPGTTVLTLVLLVQNIFREAPQSDGYQDLHVFLHIINYLPSYRLPSDLTVCTRTLNSVSSLSIERLMSKLAYIVPLAYSCKSAIQLHRWVSGGMMDCLVSLSAERWHVDPSNGYEADIYSSHSSIMKSAEVMRCLIRGSRHMRHECIDGSVSDSLKNIPLVHGVVRNCIENVWKTLPLCMIENEMIILKLNIETMVHVCYLLLKGCRERMELPQQPLIHPMTPSSILSEAIKLEKNLATLEYEWKKEAENNTIFLLKNYEEVSSQIKSIKEHVQSKAEDDFTNLTEQQIRKIRKKRAAKQAKVKKVNICGYFGAGIFSVIDALVHSRYNINQSQKELNGIVSSLLSTGMRRKPKLPKGTRDYLPDQMSIRQMAFTIIRRVFTSHGAVEIDTPVMELKEILTGKYGEDSKLIYDLANQGGESLALRYDLTVPFARFLATNSVGNIKRYHIAKVYRRDQPVLSKGRYREFYQCDFDIAGVYARMVPDAETITVLVEILTNLSLGPFIIKLNHRCLLDAILQNCGVTSNQFRTICSSVDKLDKEPWDTVKMELLEKGLTVNVADLIGTYVQMNGPPWKLHSLLQNNDICQKNTVALTAMEDLSILFHYLDAMGSLSYISFDLSLARGLDYYTGVIFEAMSIGHPKHVGSIGGGGRYDGLVSMFQDKDVPCVGVSVGIERIFTLMEERQKVQHPNVTVLVAQAGEHMITERMKVTKLLWDAHICAEFNQQLNPKLKFEISSALERGIPYMVIVGETESKEGKCKFKDLKARTEVTIPQIDLVSFLTGKKNVPLACEHTMEVLSIN